MSIKLINSDIKDFFKKNTINNLNLNLDSNQNYNQIKESYANDLFSIVNEDANSIKKDYNSLNNSISNKNNINNHIEYVDKLFDNNSLYSKSISTEQKKQKANELFDSTINNLNKECETDDNMQNLNINEIKNNLDNNNQDNNNEEKIDNESYISLSDINLNDLPKFYDKNGKILNANKNIISNVNKGKINKTKEKSKHDKKNKNYKKHNNDNDFINKNYDVNHKLNKKSEKENKKILDEDNSKNNLNSNDSPSKNSMHYLFKKANQKNNKHISNHVKSSTINDLFKNNNINNPDNIKSFNEILPININLNVNFNKNNANEIKNHFHTIQTMISFKKIFDENILSEENNNKKIKSSRLEKINLSTDSIENTNLNKTYLIDNNSLNNELSYISFLKKNNLILNNKIFDKTDNYKLQGLLKTSFFSEHFIKDETIIDLFESIEKNKQVQILQYQYGLSRDNYYKNYTNFASIFQYITDEEKNIFIQNYNKKNNNEVINSNISENFNEKENENCNYFDYIRFINKQNSECFYRCFMFCLFEIFFLNKNKENLFILIIDILRLYLIEPEIFLSKEIDMKNIMIIFSIIYDYISVNSWDKAYTFFINVYNTYEIFEKSLIEYMKYTVFLYITRISSFLWENENDKELNININDIYNFNYDLILLELFEPGKIELQSIPYIFGVNLNVFYYKNEKFSNLRKNLKKSSFNNNFTIDNVNNVINIFYFFNTFHPVYKKQLIENIIAKNNTVDNNNIYNLFFSNINESDIYFIRNIILKQNNKKNFCEICNKNSTIINIENLSINICSDCLYKEIDNHLSIRLSFLNDEQYNNFTFYLNPIEIKLKNKNNLDDTSKLFISNYDYMFLYKKTFNERFSELINNSCLICCKNNDNLISLECGCLVCYNCIQELVCEITNNLIILNKYEKDELNEHTIRCKLCKKKLNLENFIKILQKNNFDLKQYYIDANERLKYYCAIKCFSCGKDFENEIEVDNENDFFKFQVRDFIKSNDELGDSNNYKHVICVECHKMLKKKNRRIKKIDGNEYKVIYCNICGRKHCIKLKEWNNKGVCCKCVIF